MLLEWDLGIDVVAQFGLRLRAVEWCRRRLLLVLRLLSAVPFGLLL